MSKSVIENVHRSCTDDALVSDMHQACSVSMITGISKLVNTLMLFQI